MVLRQSGKSYNDDDAGKNCAAPVSRHARLRPGLCKKFMGGSGRKQTTPLVGDPITAISATSHTKDNYAAKPNRYQNLCMNLRMAHCPISTRAFSPAQKNTSR